MLLVAAVASAPVGPDHGHVGIELHGTTVDGTGHAEVDGHMPLDVDVAGGHDPPPSAGRDVDHA
jgi:hypothetical protein